MGYIGCSTGKNGSEVAGFKLTFKSKGLLHGEQEVINYVAKILGF